MEYRFPDNPISGNALNLLNFQKTNKYVAQLKWDGWRRPVYFFADKTELFAKHEKIAKTPMPKGLMEQIHALGKALPKDTAFDAEWMGPRVVQHTNGRHWMILLDLLWFDGQWMGDVPFQARWEKMRKLIYSMNGLGINDIEMCENGETDLMGTYVKSKENSLTEGIVVKDSLGTLIGNPVRCQENPGWIKVKWRA